MSDAAGDSAFLDLIYAAALDTGLWTTVLERLADLVGGHPSNLTRLSIDDTSGTGIGARVAPTAIEDYMRYYSTINPFHEIKDAGEYIRGWAPVVYAVDEQVRRDDYRGTEYFNDFSLPQGADWSMVVRLGLDLEDRSVSSILIGRPDRAGSFSSAELDLIRRVQPHLIRAHALTLKLTETRQLDQGPGSGLDTARHALFTLDESGRIRRVNPAGESLLAGAEGLSALGGRLTATNPQAAQRLAALIAAAGTTDRQRREGGAMSLPSPRRSRPLAVTVVPVQPDNPAVFNVRPAVLVCVADAAHDRAPSADMLKTSYDLTAAECRVALGLYEGLDARQMAARFGVSSNTIRVQLGSVFAKTGTHRQTELMRLLISTVPTD